MSSLLLSANDSQSTALGSRLLGDWLGKYLQLFEDRTFVFGVCHANVWPFSLLLVLN